MKMYEYLYHDLLFTGGSGQEERQDEQTGHQASVSEKKGKISVRSLQQNKMN